MQTEAQILNTIYAAKESSIMADKLIQSYLPFIRSEASKVLRKICTEQDDEFSISMIAFHEAILGYSKERGAFLPYAALLIRNRIIDYQRKEMRHQGYLSLQETDEEDIPLQDKIADNRNYFEESDCLSATQQEITELSNIMAKFGVTFTDVAENSPKQERTLESCKKAILYAIENPHLLDEVLRTKKLPLTALTKGAKVERKTLERHRKYILVMLLIQTNGYEMIRGHLYHRYQTKNTAPKERKESI